MGGLGPRALGFTLHELCFAKFGEDGRGVSDCFKTSRTQWAAFPTLSARNTPAHSPAYTRGVACLPLATNVDASLPPSPSLPSARLSFGSPPHPLPLVNLGVSMRTERGCHQNDSLADGYLPYTICPRLLAHPVALDQTSLRAPAAAARTCAWICHQALHQTRG